MINNLNSNVQQMSTPRRGIWIILKKKQDGRNDDNVKLTCLGCWGAYPAGGSANSSFLLEEEQFYLLVDCGSGVLSQLGKVIPIESLSALILSHYHHDHVADIGCLQYAMLIQNQLGKRDKPLPIYAHGEGENLFHTLSYKHYTEARRIFAEQAIQIGPWKVEFCPTRHTAYCLAVKFTGNNHTLVYTADTGWSDELIDFAKGADTMICESSLYKDQKDLVQGHMTAAEAGELAEKAGVKQLILTHFPHYGNQQELQEQAEEVFSGSVELAKEQKIWIFGNTLL